MLVKSVIILNETTTPCLCHPVHERSGQLLCVDDGYSFVNAHLMAGILFRVSSLPALRRRMCEGWQKMQVKLPVSLVFDPLSPLNKQKYQLSKKMFANWHSSPTPLLDKCSFI